MPPEASSNIDYATGTSPAADTRQDIWSLTPEQATEILEQRALDFRPRAPTSPENSRDAALRLEELSKDVGWYRKLTSGSMEARAEFERLTALKNAAPTEAMPGEQIFDVTTGEGGSGSLTRSQLIGIAEDMRREVNGGQDRGPDGGIPRRVGAGEDADEGVDGQRQADEHSQ